MAEPILIAKRLDSLQETIECFMLPALANRHGLISGATGTGKTITLQTLAESFSQRGVPVFMADVKGDLTGITQPGRISDKLAATLKERGIDPPVSAACPATLWDVFASAGTGENLAAADNLAARGTRCRRRYPCPSGRIPSSPPPAVEGENASRSKQSSALFWHPHN